MLSTSPSFLKQFDKVAIVATARFVEYADVEYAIQILESWGLKVVIPELLYQKENQFAGSDDTRSLNLQDCLDDPDIKAIFIARGGYGTIRIIDSINFEMFKLNPKWIVGFSDITVLHSHIHSIMGIETIHAPMPITFSYCSKSLDKLREVLFGNSITYNFINDENLPLRLGEAEGNVIGGNLSILYALQGSVSDIDTTNKILFIEDLDEYLYHIDRMMISLKRSGKLSQLRGLIVGSMIDMKDNKVPFGLSVAQIIYNAVKEFDFPVVFDLPFGHDKSNYPLILGRRMKLKVEKSNTELVFI